MTYQSKTIIQQGGLQSESHLTKREREQLHNSFNYENYVKSFARWAAFYGFLIGAGIGPSSLYLVTYKDVPVTGWPLFLMALSYGFGMAGILGYPALWWRGNEFRELMPEYRLDEFALPPVQPAEVDGRTALLNKKPMALERQAKTVSYGNHMFTFSGSQLDKMLQWLQQGYPKIKRDSNGEGPGLASIGITSANYSRAQMVLKGRELIDENSQWTAKGVNWLENE